jgi:uncharacterized membrane protein/protein-disulfide isomerase
MHPEDSSTVTQTSKIIAVVCAGLALGISALMTTGAIGPHTPLVGCNGEAACEAVTGSRWALMAGYPVSLLGAVGYFSLLIGLFALEKSDHPRLTEAVWNLLATAGFIGLGFIVWLTFLQWAIIRHFCFYCLTAHAVGALAFLLVLRGAPVWASRRRTLIHVTSPASLTLATLIALHVLAPPELTHVQAASDLTLGSTTSAPSASGVQIGRRTNHRVIRMLDENLSFDVFKVPLLGPREAPSVALELFDYNCPACRKVGRLVARFREEQAGRLAVILLPVPMDAACNPNIASTLTMFRDSCTYARLSLAVYMADATRFAEFHEWMLTGDFAPDPDKARARAAELVGEDLLQQALSAPEVEQWIQDGIGIYRYLKAESLPKIIAGNSVISSAGLAKEKLYTSLREALGLPAAP